MAKVEWKDTWEPEDELDGLEMELQRCTGTASEARLRRKMSENAEQENAGVLCKTVLYLSGFVLYLNGEP
jgi:hypothetical protein